MVRFGDSPMCRGWPHTAIFSDHQHGRESLGDAGSSVGERWYEFHAPEKNYQPFRVLKQGYFAPDSNYRCGEGFRSPWTAHTISRLATQSLAPKHVPSINYTGRLPYDTPGTMERRLKIVAGPGLTSFTSNRWGRLHRMAIDGADDCNILVHEPIIYGYRPGRLEK